MNKKFFLTILFLILLITGCEGQGRSSPNRIPSPEPDKSIIYGTLLSPVNEPLKGVTVRLAEVYRLDDEEGTFILDEAQSPSTISQDNGQYVFINILPGEYVLFIGKLHADYKIVSDENQVPNVYKVSPGETLRIEPVIVDFQ